MRKLVVVGTGIAGMACAYLLRDKYDITVYEKNDYAGGHTNTVNVPEGNRSLPIDSGFMVYNETTYPNLVRFFRQLGVESRNTSMSFSVNDRASGFETSFTSLTTFFPSLGSALSPRRYKLLLQLKRLFPLAKSYLADESAKPMTLAEFAQIHQIGEDATHRFLVPMAAAIWSTPSNRILDYPAQTLFRFLANHGMLGFGDQFQWKTLVGGSQQYKDKLLEKIGHKIQLSQGVRQLRRTPRGVEIMDETGRRVDFDLAIVATHADQALALLAEPDTQERKLLSSFHYNTNPVALHTDSSIMPTRKRAWASWNYRYELQDQVRHGSTHYWMNSLQDVSRNADYFVSVDYRGQLDESKVKWRHVYQHPRFDEAAIQAQKSLPELNREGPVYYCGSYFRYGFHEDAFTSALDVCRLLDDGKDPLS